MLPGPSEPGVSSGMIAATRLLLISSFLKEIFALAAQHERLQVVFIEQLLHAT